jgi:hypothetical protein
MNARPHGASVVPTVATGDEDCNACKRHARHNQALRGRTPVVVREQARDDVGDEHAAEREQDLLDAVKRGSLAMDVGEVRVVAAA